MGLEPSSLAFQASVLPLHHLDFPDVTTIAYLSIQLFASEVSADYYIRPVGIVSLVILTITYIQVMAIHIYRQHRFNNHTACSLYRILVMALVLQV